MGRGRYRVAWLLVLPVAAAELLLLVATSNRYGYHRDELYFRVAARHPAWGYDDQPALTPLLGRFSEWMFGADPRGLRMLSAVAMAVVVVLVALIARELGAGQAGQAVAALATAASGAAMAVGHLLSTTTFDVLVWVTLVFVVARILGGGDERQWLLAGLVVGIGLENKHLVLLLVFALACGCVLARRWDLARSRWLWVGAVLAFALWLPNLLWQARHGWPQLELAAEIAEEEAAENRIELVPLQFLLIGPLLAPLWLGGLWWLLRRPEARLYRPLGLAYVVLLVTALVTGAKPYYTMGLLLALLGAGGVVAEGWLRDRRGRKLALGLAIALSAACRGAHHAAARAGRGRACDADSRYQRGRHRDDRLARVCGDRRAGVERAAAVRALDRRRLCEQLRRGGRDRTVRPRLRHPARVLRAQRLLALRPATRRRPPDHRGRLPRPRSAARRLQRLRALRADRQRCGSSTTKSKAPRSGPARRPPRHGRDSGHDCTRSTRDRGRARGGGVAAFTQTTSSPTLSNPASCAASSESPES